MFCWRWREEIRTQVNYGCAPCPVTCSFSFMFHHFYIFIAIFAFSLSMSCTFYILNFFFTNANKYKETLGQILTLECNFSLYFCWLSSLHYTPCYLSLYCHFLLWKIRDPGLPSCLVLDFVFQSATALHDTCSFNRLLLLFMVRLSMPFFSGFQLLHVLNIASLDSLKFKLSHYAHSYEGS